MTTTSYSKSTWKDSAEKNIHDNFINKINDKTLKETDFIKDRLYKYCIMEILPQILKCFTPTNDFFQKYVVAQNIPLQSEPIKCFIDNCLIMNTVSMNMIWSDSKQCSYTNEYNLCNAYLYILKSPNTIEWKNININMYIELVHKYIQYMINHKQKSKLQCELPTFKQVFNELLIKGVQITYTQALTLYNKGIKLNYIINNVEDLELWFLTYSIYPPKQIKINVELTQQCMYNACSRSNNYKVIKKLSEKLVIDHTCFRCFCESHADHTYFELGLKYDNVPDISIVKFYIKCNSSHNTLIKLLSHNYSDIKNDLLDGLDI
jgi:hypothetical protein